MIGIDLAPGGSSLLWIADSIVRRAGAGETGNVLGPTLGALRTQAAGPAFSSMIELLARPENLAALAGLVLAGAVTLMLYAAESGDRTPDPVALSRQPYFL
jgi:cytochrome c biogenesis protein CcdA